MSIFDSPSTDWPPDSLDYVFLATAVQEIGRKIFGADWTGHEGKGTADEHDGDFDFPDQEGRAGPDSAVLELHGMAKTFPPMEIYRLSDFSRFAYVQSVIVEACQAGKLVSAQRPKAEGDTTDMQPHRWNTERYAHRFIDCEMNPDPFDNKIKGTCWIFISRASLEKFLSSLPAAWIYQREGPGRPTAMEYVVVEFERRIQSGESVKTVAGEAEVLHQWAKKQGHPESVVPTAKRIQEIIRKRHGTWRKEIESTAASQEHRPEIKLDGDSIC
jgi:hypothetical protein